MVRAEELNCAIGTLLMPLSQLTNLERFVVRGLCPASPSKFGTEGGCLPKSINALTVELGVPDHQGWGRDNSDKEDAQLLLNTWMAHAAGIMGLVDLCIHVGDHWFFGLLEVLDVAAVPHVTKLRFSGTASNSGAVTQVSLPDGITKLTNLQVLRVGTHSDPSRLASWPWQQHYCDLFDGRLFHQCSQLRKLGSIEFGGDDDDDDDDDDDVQAPLPHLAYLEMYCWDGSLPNWLAPCNLPVLKHLVVESDAVDALKVEQLAKLTSLTCLQLNTGQAFATGHGCGWKDLSGLGHSLPGSLRLEIVCHHLKSFYPEHGPWRLSVPDLSAFSQLQQLRLTSLPGKVLLGHRVCHQQLTAAELVRMVSCLPQIQQLELIGYVVVTPAVVSILVERMPALRVLKVGIPESQLASSQSAAEYVDAFRQVQEVYSQLRPSLQLEVFV